MSQLKPFLDRLFERYHRAEYLSSDPLEFVHHYDDPWDREAVALVCALLAYGNVKQIRRSVEAVLARIQRAAPSPKDLVRSLEGENPEIAEDAFKGFVHRFNSGTDLAILFTLLSRSWKEYGSLGAHFVSGMEQESRDFSEALNRLISDWRSWIGQSRPLSRLLRKSPSFSYLLTAPEDGSCCKRWCMFLRWMGRDDSGAGDRAEWIDPGLWAQGSVLARGFPEGKALRADQLVVPLDTHTGRISQYLGLTRRKSLNWLAALEVTESLRSCDPADPTKYDFALARLGILDLCQRKYRQEICTKCELLPVCRFARARNRRVPKPAAEKRSVS